VSSQTLCDDDEMRLREKVVAFSCDDLFSHRRIIGASRLDCRKKELMTDRPTFVIVLRPEPGVDPVRALRAALKVLLRRFGLKALEVREQDGTE
jgi:hypothetical protein